MPTGTLTRPAPTHSSEKEIGDCPPMPGYPTDYSETLECPRCRSAGAADRKFCGQCGEQLWVACPTCRQLNPLRQKYCTDCGAGLQATDPRQQSRFEKVWAEALRLREECRFSEAQEAYQALAETRRPGADELVRATQSLMYECTLERSRRQGEVRKTGELARQCLHGNDFQQADDLLAAVPEPLLTEDLRQLREQARQGLGEIRRLREALHAGQDAPLSRDMLRKLGRFLDLCPPDAAARRLTVRMRKELGHCMDNLIARRQYDHAARIFHRVPTVLFDEPLGRMRNRAEELSWLAWDLRRTPTADPALLDLAGRFCRLAPDDRKAAELYQTLASRLQKYATGDYAGPLPWAPPPERTWLGPPVEWIGNLERISLARQTETADYREFPGRFAVACGLALQGLGRGPIRWNFLREENSLLKRLAAWKLPRKAATAWGIDLGSHALKAVQLRLEGKPPHVVLEAGTCIEHRKPLGHTADEQEYQAIVAESLRTFLSRHKPDRACVCLGFSAMNFFFGQFELPGQDAAKIAPAVQFEAQHLFPLSLRDLTWDYIDLPASNRPDEKTPLRRITVVGAKSITLKNRLRTVAEAGLKPDLVQCDVAALYNYAAHNFFPHGETEKDVPSPEALPLALVNLGGGTMNFIVCSPQAFWLRNFSVGSERLNRLLVKEFKITLAQSEQWIRGPAAAPETAKLFDVLQTGFADIGQSIAEAAEAYQKVFPDVPVRRYLATGGGGMVHGLLRYLWFQR